MYELNIFDSKKQPRKQGNFLAREHIIHKHCVCVLLLFFKRVSYIRYAIYRVSSIVSISPDDFMSSRSPY